MKGDQFRKSSMDCMESPKLGHVYRGFHDEHGRLTGNGVPLVPRRIQHSINNPEICPRCQLGLNSLARACRELETGKHQG